MTSVVERGNIAITAPSDRPDPKRWLALAIIAVAQLMVVLDATIVNIALPHAQAALGISDADRSWVVTAYTLTFGGLLLLGGRIADYWGRKRTFLVGIVGFAFASALGGIAQNGETLFAARALQGAFGALLAPASLALLTVLFTEPRERARAFGVYGAIAGGGAAVGLILGGVLTEYLDWRWCLLVNIPIALIAGAFGAARPAREPGARQHPLRRARRGADHPRPGRPGVRLHQGGGPPVRLGRRTDLGFIGGSLALIAAFVVVELRSSHPLLPLRIVLDRTRGGAYAASLLTGAGLIGAALFMTYYFQGVLAVHAGRGWAGLAADDGRHLPRLPVRHHPADPSRREAADGGRRLRGRRRPAAVRPDRARGRVLDHRLPGRDRDGRWPRPDLRAAGERGASGVDPHDAGAAGAVVSASQQVGGSLGTAALSAIALSAATSYATSHAPTPTLQVEAMVHSFQVGFASGAAFLVVAGVVVLALVRGGKLAPAEGAPVHIG